MNNKQNSFSSTSKPNYLDFFSPPIRVIVASQHLSLSFLDKELIIALCLIEK